LPHKEFSNSTAPRKSLQKLKEIRGHNRIAEIVLEDFKIGAIQTGTIEGGITALQVLDKYGKVANVLSTDDDWTIIVNWELVGTMLDSPFLDIPGNWVVNAYLEGWGKDADEMDLEDNGDVSVMGDMTVVPTGTGIQHDTKWQYKKEIMIPKVNNPKAGTYKLAVTITYSEGSTTGKTTGTMAGFIEHDSMVQFIDD
jgi:hypothetical protein